MSEIENTKETFFPTYIDYTINNDNIKFRIYGRGLDSERKLYYLTQIYPYFYVKKSEFVSYLKNHNINFNNITDVSKIIKQLDDERITDIDDSYIDENGNQKHFISIKGDKLIRITARKPSDINGSNEKLQYLKDEFEETYEADVNFEDRLRINYNICNYIEVPKKLINLKINDITYPKIEGLPKLRIMIFDIENLDNKTIKQAKNGESEIVCTCIYDNYIDTYHMFTQLKLSDYDKIIIQKKLKEYWEDHPKYSYMQNAKIEYHVYANENDCLANMIFFIRANYPDVMAGWNSNNYDWTVIYERCKAIGVPTEKLSEVPNGVRKWHNLKINGMLTLDLMEMYKKMQTKTLKFTALDRISEDELGTKKLPRTSIIEMVQTNIPHLIAYNIIDVQLTKLINDKADIINFYTMLSIKTHCEIGTTYSSGFIDNLILNTMLNKSVLPTARSKNAKRNDSTKKRFGGGAVHDATIGLHKFTFLLDYASLYPSIMRSLNISIETKLTDEEFIEIIFKNNPDISIDDLFTFLLPYNDENKLRLLINDYNNNKTLSNLLKIYENEDVIINYQNLLDKKYVPDFITIAANGVTFTNKTMGIVPKILEDLTNERKLEKQLMKDATTPEGHQEHNLKQQAIKVLSNSFYGVLGYDGFRLTDIDTASAVTTTGQFISYNTREFVESMGFRVIYGDTDSLFIEMGEVYNLIPIKNTKDPKIVDKQAELFNERLNIKTLNYKVYYEDSESTLVKLGKEINYFEMEKVATDLANKINTNLNNVAKKYFNVDKHYFKIEFENEKTFKVLFQTAKKDGEAAKKRYAGYIYGEDHKSLEFKAMGFELKRADRAEITQEVQKDLLAMILKQTPIDIICDYMRNLKAKFDNEEIPQNQLALRYNIKKPLVDMDNSPMKRGAENSNNPLVLGRSYDEDDEPVFYHIAKVPKGVMYVSELCFDADEPLPEGFKIDYKESWNKLVETPMEMVLKSYGITYDFIKHGKKEKELNNFFEISNNNEEKSINKINTQIIKKSEKLLKNFKQQMNESKIIKNEEGSLDSFF